MVAAAGWAGRRFDGSGWRAGAGRGCRGRRRGRRPSRRRSRRWGWKCGDALHRAMSVVRVRPAGPVRIWRSAAPGPTARPATTTTRRKAAGGACQQRSPRAPPDGPGSLPDPTRRSGHPQARRCVSPCGRRADRQPNRSAGRPRAATEHNGARPIASCRGRIRAGSARHTPPVLPASSSPPPHLRRTGPETSPDRGVGHTNPELFTPTQRHHPSRAGVRPAKPGSVGPTEPVRTGVPVLDVADALGSGGDRVGSGWLREDHAIAVTAGHVVRRQRSTARPAPTPGRPGAPRVGAGRVERRVAVVTGPLRGPGPRRVEGSRRRDGRGVRPGAGGARAVPGRG